MRLFNAKTQSKFINFCLKEHHIFINCWRIVEKYLFYSNSKFKIIYYLQILEFSFKNTEILFWMIVQIGT